METGYVDQGGVDGMVTGESCATGDGDVGMGVASGAGDAEMTTGEESYGAEAAEAPPMDRHEDTQDFHSEESEEW